MKNKAEPSFEGERKLRSERVSAKEKTTVTAIEFTLVPAKDPILLTPLLPLASALYPLPLSLRQLHDLASLEDTDVRGSSDLQSLMSYHSRSTSSMASSLHYWRLYQSSFSLPHLSSGVRPLINTVGAPLLHTFLNPHRLWLNVRGYA
jgi:hypothetical protein